MTLTPRATRLVIRASLALGISLAVGACGTGSVYVGVAAPGPWVGYPPGVYGGYPGYYGRPWYAPDEDAPQEDETTPALDEEPALQMEMDRTRLEPPRQ